jgi:hypothetical protein
VWIIYVATDKRGLAWTELVIVLVVALMGFTMLARWIPTYRATRSTNVANVAAAGGTADAGPAERHFPLAAVAGHGLLAATTLVLVLLTALKVGGS